MKNLNPLQKEINLRQAVLLGKDISNTDLCYADLQKTNLKGYGFTDKDLTSINLSEAFLAGSNFTRAILSNANLSGAKIDRIWERHKNQSIIMRAGADLEQANLSSAGKYFFIVL